MRRKYGLRVPGTDTLIKKFWTIANLTHTYTAADYLEDTDTEG